MCGYGSSHRGFQGHLALAGYSLTDAKQYSDISVCQVGVIQFSRRTDQSLDDLQMHPTKLTATWRAQCLRLCAGFNKLTRPLLDLQMESFLARPFSPLLYGYGISCVAVIFIGVGFRFSMCRCIGARKLGNLGNT